MADSSDRRDRLIIDAGEPIRMALKLALSTNDKLRAERDALAAEVERLRAAVAGSATPTADHVHLMSAVTGRCVVCDLTAEYIKDAAGSAASTGDNDD